ncbi:MAG: phosphoglycerate dehydrogenase [Alphaproteobacteria bacterium]|nr:phosphoglycerate dehydrogenase [Alphaproteobacteria bacterium]
MLSSTKIVLLENIHASAVNYFKSVGLKNLEQHKKALSVAELSTKISDISVLGIRSKTELTKNMLLKANNLMTVGCFCIGTNQVDLSTALKQGIAVFNAPYSNTRSVAELVIGVSIMLIRRIPEKNNAAHSGVWLKEATNSRELRGKTLGIIGYGNIGMQLSILAESLGLKILYYDIETKLPIGNAIQVKTLTELVSKSDLISLHVPDNASTKNLIQKNLLKKFKKGSILINYARGEVVHINDLKWAIDNEIISGVALDVYPIEPEKNGDPFLLPLQGYPNVILTPHIGGSTEEAQANIGEDVSKKIANYLLTGSSIGCLTIPALQLPNVAKQHRICHIHHNKKGVLSSLNAVFSKNNLNIVAQYLKTNDTLGYVVLDVDKPIQSHILNDIQKVPHTIKARFI